MGFSSASRRGRALRAVLCAGGSVLALALTGAQAADTTWTGATPDFTLNTNWSTAVPTTSDNAIFGSTGATTISLASATDARAQSFTFNAGAPQYTFSIGSGSANPSILTFTGAGIINNSGNAPIFNLVDAGFGYTQLNFGDFSGTGSATTTAGNAIINSDSAVIQFSEHATAGTAIITQTGSSGLNFRQNSSADHATISGFIQFQDNATADHAAISDINYQLNLSGNATLGNATVTTSAGTIYFSGSSTGGSAAVALSGSASINLQSLTASGITLGSLSGTGGSDIVALGSKNLTLGSLGGTQAFDGSISGTGGSLTKTGTGTLTLSGGTNDYTGATTVSAGTLAVTGAVTGSTVTVSSAAKLGGSGTVKAVTVSSGGTLGAGAATGAALGTLTISNSLTLNSGSILELGIDTSAGNDTLALTAQTINLANAALKIDAAAGTYTAGTYTLITDTIAGLSGNFSSVTINSGSIGGLSASTSIVGNNLVLTLSNPTYNWTGATNDYNTASNWDAGLIPGTGPSGVFGTTGSTTVNVNATTTSGGLTFNAGANAYAINVGTSGAATTFTLDTAGIVNNSSNTQAFTVTGNTGSNYVATLAFTGAAAGDANSTVSLTNAKSTLDISGTTTGITLGAVTGSGTVALGAKALTISNAATDSFTGVIGGSGGALVKNGAGDLVLGGVNTYTGGTTVNAGVLAIAADSGIGGSSGALTLAGGTLQFGGTFNLSSGRTITLGAGGGTFDTRSNTTTISQAIGETGGARALTKIGSGTLTLAGANSYTGGTTINAGVLSLSGSLSGTGTITLNGGTLQSGTTGLSYNNAFAVGASGGTYDTNSKNTTIRGDVSGGNAFTKVGGGTLTLGNSSNALGAITVSAGELQIGDIGHTPSNTLGGAFSIAANSTLSFYAGGNYSLNNTITGAGSLTNYGSGSVTLSGDVSGFTGTIDASQGSSSNAVTLSGGSSFGGTVKTGGGGHLTVNDSGAFALSGTLNTPYLDKQGSGTLTLTASNSFGGTNTIQAGTVIVGNGATTGSIQGSTSISSGATLAFNRSDTVTFGTGNLGADKFSGSGTVKQQGSGTLVIVGTSQSIGALNIASGTVQLGDNSTSTGFTNLGAVSDSGTLVFKMRSADAYTYSGAISGSGSVEQAGAGTVTLSGNSNYAGATTVSAGTLQVTGTVQGSVNVNSGGTLAGTGTVGGPTIFTGGILAPGVAGVSGGIGTLNGAAGNNLNLTSGSIFDVDIAAGNNNSDRVALSNGTASMTGSTLQLEVAAGAYTAGTTYNLITGLSADPGTYFSGITVNSGTLGSLVASASYSGGNIVLTLNSVTFNWTGGATDFNTGSDWDSGVAPSSSSTAIFGAAGSSTVTIGSTTTVGGMQFDAGGNAYSLNVTASGSANSLTLANTGIVNNSGQTQTFNITGDTGGSFGATLGFTGAASGDTNTGVNLVNGQSNLDISGSNSGITIKDLGGAGVVTLGGKILTIANGGSTFSGAIHGTGGLVVGGGTVALTGNNDYSGGTTVSGTLRLGSSTAAGTGTITTTGSVIDYADGDVIANPININSNTTQLRVTTGSATQQGVISETAGPRPVEKTGAGTLILTGTETYTGVTTITAGTLQVGSGGTAGALGSGNVTDNGALVFNRSNSIVFAGAITGSGSVAQQGSGTLTLTGTSGYTGGTTVSNGTLTLGTLGNTAKIMGTIAVPGGTLLINYADLTGVTAVTNTEGTLLFNNASNAGSMTITTSGPGDPGGFITTRFANTSSAGTAIINTGTDGGVFVQDTATLGTAHITNAGTLSNTTIIMGAALILRSSAALTTPVIVNNTAGFTFAQNNSDLGQASITNNANGLLIFEKGSSVGINAPTANSATIVNNNGGVTSFSLPSGNNGLAFGQRISGSNINVSSDAGTAANATITNNSGGATYFFSGTSGGSATLINNAGGTLDISGLSISGTTLGSLSGAGNVFLGSKSLTLTGNADAAIAGVIADGGTASGTGGSLVKQGTGTLVLTGANTYTGTTTVNAGTLQLGIGDGDPAPALGTGAVTIASGATLFLNVGAGLNVNSAISGGGTLIAGGVDVTLTANNSYGATIINSGATLRFGQNASGSLGTGNVTDNGELYIARSDTVTLSQVVSGSGNFRAVAGGTVILTAANSYAGFTDIVNGSTLSLSGSGSIANTAGVRVNQVGDVFDITAITPPSASIGWLMGSGAVNLGGKTLVITAGFGEFDGTINGSGGLTLAGGTTTLGSNVTFAGTTTIASGASLQFGVRNKVGAGSAAGSLTGPIVNNGTLVIFRSNTFTLSSTVTGSGAIIVGGGGTAILANAYAFGGATIIPGSTLQLGNGGTAGSIGSGAITDNGTLSFNRTDTLTMADAISGTGRLIKSGSGTLVLSGSSNYSGGTTIAAGTLRLASNAGAGTGAITTTGSVIDYADGVTIANPININSNTTQLQVTTGSATQIGVISETGGSRPLEKIGAGTLVLSGSNTYSGATTVSGGTLSVTGSIGSPLGVTVQNTAALTGTGAVGPTTVQSGGVLLPGVGGIGTLTVNGNLNLQGGSQTAFFLNQTDNSRLVITGAASLGGTAFALFAVGGAAYAPKQYTLLTATGGLGGSTFVGLNTLGSPAGLVTGLSYDATHVYLNLSSSSFIWKAAPATSDWNSGGNWTAGTVPTVTDTAIFAATAMTGVTVAQDTSVKSIQFNAGAPVYNFDIVGNAGEAVTLNIATGGMVNNSGNVPNISVRGNDSVHTGTLAFNGTGTAANANIVAGAFGTVTFNGLTDAGANAQLAANPNGFIDFSATAGLLGDNKVNAGSITGTGGTINLGANTLTVGALNTSTEFGGAIIGTGALTKTGTGTLILSDNSGYTGTTTVSAGALQIGNGGTLGSIASGTVSLAAGTSLIVNHNSTYIFSGAIIGAGSLNNLAGTLTLTGASNYTGGTTIAAGSFLALGNGGTIGAITGNIVDNGRLAFARTDTVTFDGVISGTGGVSLASNGKVILTGDNTYSGGTNATSGNLQVGAGGTTGTLGTGDVLIANTLTFNRSNSLTYGGVISGGGTVTVATGQVILTGNNTFNGGGATIANGATLQIGAGGTSGAIATAAVTDNGTVIFNRSDASAFTGGIGGAGSMTKLGAGTLTLTGNNSYTGGTTINAGSLSIGVGGTTGVIAGNITDNAALAFNRSNALTYAGVISGTGSLAKAGAGTLTLSGTSTYTGATAVSGGVLNLTGSIARSSGVTVQTGATLGGTGTVASTAVQSGGILAPGAGVGTLNVAGNLTLNSGATYTADLSPTLSDLVSVTGTANVAGTLSASFAEGAYTPGKTYTLLTSTGLLSGSFDNLVVSNAPANYLTLLSYDAHDVFLTLAPKDYIWNQTPVSTDWNTGGNWKYGLVPGANDIAQFDATTGATVVDSGAAAAKSLQFNAGAPAYSLAVTGTANGAASLTISQGITDASSNAPTIAVSGASATNSGKLAFTGTGNADAAAITAGAFGTVSFAGTTDAGAASKLAANAGGTIDFSATTGANGDGKVVAGSIAGTGAGSIVLGANTLTTGALGVSTEFAGVISGTGALVKTGSGTLILSGVNTYTGTTTVNAGVLSVNGSVAGAVSVAGGTLKGSGRIGTVTVAGGATVAPGNSIGTLSVGSISFAAGSTYQAEVNAAGQSDLINASGIATLNGTLQAVEAGGPYAPVTTYRIINATGISGTFSSVTSSQSNLTPSLSYGAGSVDLKLVRNDLAFGASGNTFNQIAAGNAVSAGGISTGLYNSLAAVANNAAAVPAALDSLSGEIHASLRSAMLEDSHVIRDTLMDRLSMPASGTTVWAQGFTSSGYLDSDGNAARAARNLAGVAGGIDTVLDNLRLGFGGSRSGNKLSVAARGSSATGSSGTLFAYAGWKSGALAVSLGGDLGWGDTHIVRAVSALSETESSSRHGTTGEVFAQASYDIDLATVLISPYVALDHVSASTDAFSETGGIGALSGGNATLDRTYALMGARGTLGQFKLGDMPLTPRAGLSWSHAFGGAAPAEALALRSTGQTFTVLGTPAGSDAALLSLGLDLNILPQLPVTLGYDGAFSNRGQSHTVHGGLGWTF